MKKVIRFSATWCGPCKSLASSLEGVDIGVPVEVVDIDENSKVAREYQIRSVPTMILIEDGKEKSRLLGANSVETIKKWVTT